MSVYEYRTIFRYFRPHEIYTINLYCHYLPFLQEMLKEGKSITNYDSQRLITKTHDRSILPCDKCYQCATYFDKTRLPGENICPQCNANNNELTSFPIMPNESFTFIYDDKRGVELEFKPRLKDSQ